MCSQRMDSWNRCPGEHLLRPVSVGDGAQRKMVIQPGCMPARVITCALGPGRGPAIESMVKTVFKDVPEQWYVSILGSQGNPSRWRMTIETPDGQQTSRTWTAMVASAGLNM